MQARTHLDIDALRAAFLHPENADKWIAIPDSHTGIIWAGAGSSGGNPGNGWKIHISIDPERMIEAALLIAEQLNQPGAPAVSIKFAGSQLAATGQPSKQVAFIFYNVESLSSDTITQFLMGIEKRLTEHKIGNDPRPINSDEEALKTKFDASIMNSANQPTRFHYRNENCIVMEDEVYREITGTNKPVTIQNLQVLVKQSAFQKMPVNQKHNPGNIQADPFVNIRPPAHSANIETLTTSAKKEDISSQRSQLTGYIVRRLARGRFYGFRIFGCSKKTKIAAGNAIRTLMDNYESSDTTATFAEYLQTQLPGLKKHKRALNQGELGRIFNSMLPQHESTPRRRRCC